jgi:hypothetical protein
MESMIVMRGLDPRIHLERKMDCRAYAAPKGLRPAGGSSPAMTT